MRIRGRWMRTAALLAAGVTAALVGMAAPLAAQAPTEVAIQSIDLAEDGATRVVVSVTGSEVPNVLPDAAFTIQEDGEPVTGIAVSPLLETQDGPQLTGVLVLDTSGSTEGEPLAAARAAADAFVGELAPRDVRLGLVRFSELVEVLAPPGTAPAELRAGLAGLTAGGETALYDAVVRAAALVADAPGPARIVVFTDGADTVSAASLEETVVAVRESGASMTAVALQTEEFDLAPLTTLTESTEGGTVLRAGEAGDLAAAFQTVSQQIASQYVVTYTAAANTSPLDIEVAVSVAGQEATDAATVSNPRRAPGAAEPRPFPLPDASPLAEQWALNVGLVASFLGLAALLVILGLTVADDDRERRLQERLRVYTGKASDAVRRQDLSARGVARQFAGLIEALPKPTGFEERLQLMLDRAGLPLRASEMLGLQVLTGLGAGLLAWALSGGLALAVLALPIGLVAPHLWLMIKVDRRTTAFLEQLPDTLSLLGGSLRAGYGLVQAMDTVVRESPSPTSEEFARALTETRLGMPLGEALGGMADRIGSEDFEWAVLAIDIQSQIGGNLAELLDTVSETLRDRARVRRQIKVLSAEGRISAGVLVGLPFFMALYLLLTQPDYISLLWTETVGRVMLAGGAILMVLAVQMIRRMIKIEV